MNELGLYAGAGGGLLASRLLGWRTVCCVERDPYCIAVLRARMRDGHLAPAPIWDDVRTFRGRRWRGAVDIVSGGFPCQPYSAAGHQLAEGDPRNLWPDTIRIIREVRPEWCFLENVARLLSYSYFGTILGDLAESGFDVAWDVVPACAFGAPHTRERLFIVAHSSSIRRVGGGQRGNGAAGIERGIQGIRPLHSTADKGLIQTEIWKASEADVLRMADGVGPKLDRLRAIGNGQVPIVATTAWRLLSERLS